MSALVRASRPHVLLLATDLELLVDLVRALPHMLLEERRPESVVDNRVDHFRVAHAGSESSFRDDVRSFRHRLHAARDHNLDLTGADQLIGEGDRIEARQAHLIDGDGRHLLRKAGLDRRLARGDLSRARLQDLPHDHVIDVIGFYA